MGSNCIYMYTEVREASCSRLVAQNSWERAITFATAKVKSANRTKANSDVSTYIHILLQEDPVVYRSTIL